MSYCRFSSDDFGCDVYVYQSADGYCTHVASIRYAGENPIPPLPRLSDPSWPVQFQAQLAWIATADRVPIGLQYDGETFVDGNPAACANRLAALAAMGYQVPQYAIDALRAED